MKKQADWKKLDSILLKYVGDNVGNGCECEQCKASRKVVKDAILKELKRERVEIRKGLEALTKDVKSHNLRGLVIKYRDLDNYLKEREK